MGLRLVEVPGYKFAQANQMVSGLPTIWALMTRSAFHRANVEFGKPERNFLDGLPQCPALHAIAEIRDTHGTGIR